MPAPHYSPSRWAVSPKLRAPRSLPPSARSTPADTLQPADPTPPANATPPAPAENAPPAPPPAAADEPPPAAPTTAAWPMWGGTPARNMACEETGLNLDFDLRADKNVVWWKNLGTQTYGNPVVADGKVFVGTNNGEEYRPKHKGDRGVVLCFDQASGELLWQLTREKLLSGQVQDWPEQGICSSAVVEGDRLWVVTNRCELICLDTEGFHDGENDGSVQDEVDNEELDADIVWVLDMIGELGVFPHNLATSSPLLHGDRVYLVTSNGVDEAHLELPSPAAPSFLKVDKNTGEVAWENNDPFDKVLHGQWSSPALGVVNGRTLALFPGGNGWVYAFDAETGEEVWRFDVNPKETVWELGGRGSRNNIIATPVFYENSVIVGVGQDPEHGEGVGHLWRIDATKTGDVSAELGEIGSPGQPNPNSAVLWHYGGVDKDGSVTGSQGEPIFRRTISTVAAGNGLLFAADLSGFVHCLDLQTGKRHWIHDQLSAIWGSPLLVDGKVLIGNEDGKLTVYQASPEGPNVLAEFETVGYSSIYSTPTIVDGHMYLADRTRIYCVKLK